jgi:hypothetical protein
MNERYDSAAAAWEKQTIAFGQLARLGALDLSTVDSDMPTGACTGTALRRSPVWCS